MIRSFKMLTYLQKKAIFFQGFHLEAAGGQNDCLKDFSGQLKDFFVALQYHIYPKYSNTSPYLFENFN